MHWPQKQATPSKYEKGYFSAESNPAKGKTQTSPSRRSSGSGKGNQGLSSKGMGPCFICARQGHMLLSARTALRRKKAVFSNFFRGKGKGRQELTVQNKERQLFFFAPSLFWREDAAQTKHGYRRVSVDAGDSLPVQICWLLWALLTSNCQSGRAP